MTMALRPGVHRGTVALVTGGGTGIGRAVALDLARCGADVVICGRRPEPLEKTVAEIESLGGRALDVPADIRDDDQVVGLVDRALERFGRIDTLVNNAGGQFTAPAEEITTKGWRAVHRVAVDAAWAVTREVAVRAMIPQRSGVIFFTAFSPRRGIALDGACQFGPGRTGEPGSRTLTGVEPIRDPDHLRRTRHDRDRGHGAELLRRTTAPNGKRRSRSAASAPRRKSPR